MEDNFNQELDDELFGTNDVPQQQSVEQPLEIESEYINEPSPTSSRTYVEQMLADRGIDKHNIRFLNENGDIELYDFDDLPEHEKYALLNQQEPSPITDDELRDLNYLRRNKINLLEFAKYVQDQSIKDYLAQNGSIQNYSVDSFSDDDLFAFDLHESYPELTDEEIETELERAKANPDIFDKKIKALRAEYKLAEEEEVAKQLQQAQLQYEQDYNSLVQSLVNSAKNINDLHGLILEDTDKEEILSFLLDRDVNGQSQFSKLFTNPDMLFKMAWYILKGDQAFNAISDYFKRELAQARGQFAKKPRVIRKSRGSSSDPDDWEDDLF